MRHSSLKKIIKNLVLNRLSIAKAVIFYIVLWLIFTFTISGFEHDKTQYFDKKKDNGEESDSSKSNSTVELKSIAIAMPFLEVTSLDRIWANELRILLEKKIEGQEKISLIKLDPLRIEKGYEELKLPELTFSNVTELISDEKNRTQILELIPAEFFLQSKVNEKADEIELFFKLIQLKDGAIIFEQNLKVSSQTDFSAILDSLIIGIEKSLFPEPVINEETKKYNEILINNQNRLWKKLKIIHLNLLIEENVKVKIPKENLAKVKEVLSQQLALFLPLSHFENLVAGNLISGKIQDYITIEELSGGKELMQKYLSYAEYLLLPVICAYEEKLVEKNIFKKGQEIIIKTWEIKSKMRIHIFKKNGNVFERVDTLQKQEPPLFSVFFKFINSTQWKDPIVKNEIDKNNKRQKLAEYIDPQLAKLDFNARLNDMRTCKGENQPDNLVEQYICSLWLNGYYLSLKLQNELKKIEDFRLYDKIKKYENKIIEIGIGNNEGIAVGDIYILINNGTKEEIGFGKVIESGRENNNTKIKTLSGPDGIESELEKYTVLEYPLLGITPEYQFGFYPFLVPQAVLSSEASIANVSGSAVDTLNILISLSGMTGIWEFYETNSFNLYSGGELLVMSVMAGGEKRNIFGHFALRYGFQAGMALAMFNTGLKDSVGDNVYASSKTYGSHLYGALSLFIGKTVHLSVGGGFIYYLNPLSNFAVPHDSGIAWSSAKIKNYETEQSMPDFSINLNGLYYFVSVGMTF